MNIFATRSGDNTRSGRKSSVRGRRRSVRASAVLGAMMLVVAACAGATDDAAPVPPAAGAPVEPAPTAVERLDFYDGKTLTIVQPGSAGPGNEAFLAPWLEKYLEGNVRVVVDVKGGPAVRFFNEFDFAGAERDGLSIIHSAGSVILAYGFNSPGASYDLSAFEPLGTIGQNGILYVSPDTGIKTAQDLVGYSGELFMAALSAISSVDTVLPMDLLDIGVKPTFGYEGSNARRTAFLQGESNINVDNTGNYKKAVLAMVDAGEAIPIASYGIFQGSEIVRDPAHPDLPTIPEVYELVHGSPMSGVVLDAYKLIMAMEHGLAKTFFIPAGAPPAAIAALRDAFDKISRDPEFIAAALEVFGEYPLIVGEPLRQAFDVNLFNLDPAALAFVKAHMLEVYGVNLDAG